MEDLSNYYTALACQAELQTDMDSHETNNTDPRKYNAKFSKRGRDLGAPTFNQALSVLEADKYMK